MAGEKTEGQGLTTADALLFAAAAGVAGSVVAAKIASANSASLANPALLAV